MTIDISEDSAEEVTERNIRAVLLKEIEDFHKTGDEVLAKRRRVL